MTNETRVSSKQIKAERMSREEQNMLIELARGFRTRYGRTEMVVARRLARKGLAKITHEKFSDGSSATWVTGV